ncbi:acyl-CoA dehydrogenase family member enigma [Leptinotarsa decemlineata]|uniref:acyl-CoA dehydrogenase family member enigma n=1 Tax=Leptinotarsa decemlineata TaxID=7539 RepID=UPI003D3048B3
MMSSTFFIRNTRTLKSSYFPSKLLFNSYATSQPVVQNPQERFDNQLKDFETLTNINKKARKKKPQKSPFVKNLLLGVFDTDILTYPQLEKDEVHNLEKNVSSVKKLMKQNHMMNCNSLQKNFRQNLYDHKAIGLQALQIMDGMECNITESLAFLEALSEHSLAFSIVNNEQLGVQSLVKYGSDYLKKEYLVPAMKGESLTAFCISEAAVMDISNFQTKAELSQDGKLWILNGHKTWVINGVSADILIVFAITDVVKRDTFEETRLSAFVVEKDFQGVSVGSNHQTAGIEATDITFTDTPVPVENVIGEVNKAQELLPSLINEYRLSISSICCTVTRKLLNNMIKDILEKSDEKNLLHKTDAVQEKIGQVTTSLYAMESISYLTAGLIDNYENQDCEMECAIAKIFATENTMKTSLTCLDLIGTLAASETHWANILHKETLLLSILHESSDNLKIITSLLGLQYAGVTLNERIGKIRNPLFYAGFTLAKMWSDRRNVNDDPKLDLKLGEYLHPSTMSSSQNLEYCVKRLEFAVEVLLARHGPEIVNQHMELRRLAEVIIDIYGMTACLGRASRSYCIGLQHGDYEMMIANTFCNYAVARVKENVKLIYLGTYHTNDENYRVLSKRAFKFKEYFPKHPLSRNF